MDKLFINIHDDYYSFASGDSSPPRATSQGTVDVHV